MRGFVSLYQGGGAKEDTTVIPRMGWGTENVSFLQCPISNGSFTGFIFIINIWYGRGLLLKAQQGICKPASKFNKMPESEG